RKPRLGEDVGRPVAVDVRDGQVLDVVEALQVSVLWEPGGGLVPKAAVPGADEDLHDATDVPLRVAADEWHRSTRRGDDEIDMPIVIDVDRLDVEGLGRASECLRWERSRQGAEMPASVVQQHL